MFSSAHFYAQEKFSPQENLAHFGRCYTPFGHGHNYRLEVCLEGFRDPETGLVLNINDLNECLRLVCDPLDHQHLNFDVAEFKERVPTTENIALYLNRMLQNHFNKLTHFTPMADSLVFQRLRLYECDDIWVDLLNSPLAAPSPQSFEKLSLALRTSATVSIHVTRSLARKDWSTEKNAKIFGKEMGRHGHRFDITIVANDAGLKQNSDVFTQGLLAEIMRDEIVMPFDGKDLDLLLEDSSSETLLLTLRQRLRSRMPSESLLRLSLQDGRGTHFEVDG
jgi:6-pyruvoyltetrahydropterin/6-carboxytetrahydropterin synthase